jgi:hypothetical protein
MTSKKLHGASRRTANPRRSWAWSISAIFLRPLSGDLACV